MNQAPPPPPNLRITFPPPGFFLVDARLIVTIDGHPAHDGSFKQGLDRVFFVYPGHHQITVFIDMGGISRNRVYPITLSPNRGYSLILEYSRFWGNFASTPKIVENG
ncbi:MAG: hypothetical protein JWO86_6730 [Myxococcaceae bacterium]|nr:hypothetical protein [Myxococcaceae bacterium]